MYQTICYTAKLNENCLPWETQQTFLVIYLAVYQDTITVNLDFNLETSTFFLHYIRTKLIYETSSHFISSHKDRFIRSIEM